MKQLVLSLCVLMFSASAFGLKVKLATLVPKGTSWAKTLKEMSDEIKEKTKGKVKFQIYYGGTQGDEPDILRKTRIGQLHGGIFTGKTLGDIFSDVRAIELPFNFYDDEKKASTQRASENTEEMILTLPFPLLLPLLVLNPELPEKDFLW